jgi:hypothetical protein
MEEITIGGTVYQVIRRKTVEDFRDDEMPNVAAHMELNGVVEDLYLCKPKGEVVFSSALFANGQYSTPRAIPRSLMRASEFRKA